MRGILRSRTTEMMQVMATEGGEQKEKEGDVNIAMLLIQQERETT